MTTFCASQKRKHGLADLSAEGILSVRWSLEDISVDELVVVRSQLLEPPPQQLHLLHRHCERVVHICYVLFSIIHLHVRNIHFSLLIAYTV